MIELLKRCGNIPITLLGFIKKEYKVLFKQKKYFYLAILLPLLIGIIYIVTLTGSTDNLSIGVCDHTKKNLSVFSDMNAEYTNCTTLQKSVKQGEYLFGVEIPSNFWEDLDSLQQAELIIYYDNTDPSISSLVSWRMDAALIPLKNSIVKEVATDITTQAKSAKDKTEIALAITEQYVPIQNKIKEIDSDLGKISSLDKEFLISPITTTKQGVFKDLRLIDIGIASLFVVLSLFLTVMLTSTSIIQDRKNNILNRVRASQAFMFSYILSKIIVFMSLVFAQFIILSIIFLLFGATLMFNAPILLTALLFIGIFNPLLGILIGLISDTEGVSILLSLILTLPAFFLSGMFYPYQLLPKTLQILGSPIQIQIQMMKNSILGISSNPNYFFILLGVFIITLYLIKKK